jgi:hypothetical protein
MRGLTSQERTSVLALVSLFVAALSLTAAFYQNYIQTKYVEMIQRNVSRGEYNRACRDVIEAYFQVKLKVGLMLSERGGAAEGKEAMFDIEAATRSAGSARSAPTWPISRTRTGAIAIPSSPGSCSESC